VPGSLSGQKRFYSPFPSRTHWSLELNNALTTQPAFDGGFGFFPIEGDRIAAYDLTSGSLLWIVMAAPQSAPVASGGLLYLEQHEKLTALKTADGSVAWERPLSDKLAVPLAVADQYLFAATSGALTAYQAMDGAQVWTREVAGVRSTPTVLGNYLYASLDDGRIVALSAENGEPAWARKIGGMPNAILADDTQLFVGSTNNYLYCLKRATGEVNWTKITGADVVHRPVADKDTVYFVSLDNVLRALNRGHGVQLWMRGLPFRPAWAPVIAMDAVVVAGLALPPRAYFMKTGLAADALTTTQIGDIASPLHTFVSPLAWGPMMVLVTRGLSGQATVTATSRTIEPPPLTVLSPFPNATPVQVPKT
jgi:outer membrane protein assembly factor BamB